MSSVHIIGAGLAGLAAAVELSGTDRRICLYEATTQAGGRCRSYPDPVLGRDIDNGNHLMLKANHYTRDYIGRIGAQPLFHTPQTEYPFVDIKYGHRWTLKGPFFLPKLPLIDYVNLLRLGLFGGCVSDYAAPYGDLSRRFLHPLCTSMLNTPPTEASARLFAKTLRRIFLERGGAHPLLPMGTLHEALIAPALSLLTQQGCDIYYQQSLKRIAHNGQHITELHFSRNVVSIGRDDCVILAIPSYGAKKLMPELDTLQHYHAIVNGHFLYPHGEISGHFTGAVGGWVDWIFFKDGMLSTTSSAAGTLADMDQDVAATLLWQDICHIMQWTAPMPPYRIVTEKRAAFAATTDNLRRRPPTRTNYGNLFLAGDYVQTGLPATIEGAITSGMRAAAHIRGM